MENQVEQAILEASLPLPTSEEKNNSRTTFVKNATVEAVIEGYNSEGSGVCHLDGRVLFVPHAARGDHARLTITRVTRSGPVYAHIQSLLTPSEHRTAPLCSAYPRCGGCDFWHISYEEELFAKAQRVRDALHKIAGCTLPFSLHPASDITGYRNKALFPVRMGKEGPVTGFFRARSHEIVPTDTCLLQSEEANLCARILCDFMKETGLTAYDETSGQGLVRHLCVRTAEADNDGKRAVLLVLVTTAPPPDVPQLVQAFKTAPLNLAGIVNIVNTRRDNVIFDGPASVLYGAPYLIQTLMGLSFQVSATSFFQVNTRQAEVLYSIAADYAEAENQVLVDLCCGTGTSTFCIGRGARRAVGVEIDAQAVEDAQKSAERFGTPQFTFLCGDVAHVVAEDDAGLTAADSTDKLRVPRSDVVTVDPPRRGLTPETIAAIARLSPRRVVYLSCDPATLARDMKALGDFGYKPVKLAVVDLFPRTANVETVALLEK